MTRPTDAELAALLYRASGRVNAYGCSMMNIGQRIEREDTLSIADEMQRAADALAASPQEPTPDMIERAARAIREACRALSVSLDLGNVVTPSRALAIAALHAALNPEPAK